MNCSEFRKNVNSYLDLSLDGRTHNSMELHRDKCPSCGDLCDELSTVKQFLSTRSTLPKASAELVLKRIQRRRRFAVRPWLVELFSSFRSYFRDLDYSHFWLRISSAPISALFFFALFQSLAPVNFEKLPFLLLSSERPSHSVHSNPPTVVNVEVRQNRAEFNDLVDTAWRLPYEDSLSLVAEIDRDGFAQIGDVLEYPKSPALFSAVDLALKQTQFDKARDLESLLLIYSFQKIDVYEDVYEEDSRGL